MSSESASAPKKYTGQHDDRLYHGEKVDVTYNINRCIHSAFCTRRLSEVFDREKRPWINPDSAPADAVTKVVGMCPSGALHVVRKDGYPGEQAPTHNTIKLEVNGPLEIHADMDILGANVDVHGETRAALCRCGASHNKPFCDDTHREIKFVAPAVPVMTVEPLDGPDGKLTINPQPNGPLVIRGRMRITNANGEPIFTGEEAWLCRCGNSSNKPFCDDTHLKVNFQAE
jgi:CDGSH-type Zn-finger protein/uncharacterized Fe-S cluster protein YjdI